jgi:hypothetical protein
MQKMRKFTHRKLVGMALAGLLVVAAAVPAGADEHSQDSEPGFTIAAGTGPRFDDTNGSNTFPLVNDFDNITLNGTPQLTVATIDPFVVVDDSGDLAGWNVTLTIPDFEDGTGAGCATDPDHTVDAAGISMNPPVVAAATGDTSMNNVAPAGFTDFTSAQKIIVADAGAGMGSYSVSPQLVKLVVPVSSAAGAYCTTATIAIASGP